MQLVTKHAELALNRSYWAFRKDKSSKPVKVGFRLLDGNPVINEPGSVYRTVDQTFELFELVGPIKPEDPPNLERYKRLYYNPPKNLCLEVALPHSEATVHLKGPLLQEPWSDRKYES